jgi:Vanillate O-demethylase oxygenase C-terminal domain
VVALLPPPRVRIDNATLPGHVPGDSALNTPFRAGPKPPVIPILRVFRGLNAVTPETDDTTHYFRSAAHNFWLNEPEVTEAIYQNIVVTFGEDKDIIESQYRNRKRSPNRPFGDISFDVAPVLARRVWTAMIVGQKNAQAIRPGRSHRAYRRRRYQL